MAAKTYDDKVRVVRKASAIAGVGEETTTFDEMRRLGGILKAFADDDDIQQITVVSTNIGFVREYTKQFMERV